MNSFKTIITALLLTVVMSANAQKMDTLSYSVGILIANNFKSQGLDKVDGTVVGKAISEYLAGKATMTLEQANANFEKKAAVEREAKAAERKANAGPAMAEGAAFLEANKKRPGVMTTASGLQYEVMTKGTGTVSPTPTDKVTTHYHGTLISGKVFDSSVQRGQPIEFPVNGVIAGWTEALQLMHTGDKFKLFIPYNLAYGERGAGGDIGPYAALVFEVELIKIN